MFTIKVSDHLRSFGKFITKEDAHRALVEELGWRASAITDGYYKDGLTATVIPYYEPLSLDDLRMLKTCKT